MGSVTTLTSSTTRLVSVSQVKAGDIIKWTFPDPNNMISLVVSIERGKFTWQRVVELLNSDGSISRIVWTMNGEVRIVIL